MSEHQKMCDSKKRDEVKENRQKGAQSKLAQHVSTVPNGGKKRIKKI